jgi:hypothetical protein
MYLLDPLLNPPPAPVTINGTTYNLSALSPPLNISDGYFNIYDNKVYNQSWAENNYVCISGGQYAWGFSAWFLIISVTLHGLWCIFMYFIWLHAQHRSRLCRRGRRLGTLRAVSDLADAMREEIGPDIRGHTENQLMEGLKGWRGVEYTFEEAEVDDESLNARLVFVGREHK